MHGNATQSRPKRHSALSNLGFKASFGQIKINNLIEDFFPLVAFRNDGGAVLIPAPPVDNKIVVLEPVGKKNIELSISDFKKNYSSFFLIAKQLNDREKEERSGHSLVHFEKVNGSIFSQLPQWCQTFYL